MFHSSFRGASVPLFLASAGLGLALVGCGGGSGTNLPTPGSGQGGLGTNSGGTTGGGTTGGGTAGGGTSQLNNTLVFVSTRDGNPEIYSAQSNGTGARRLTNDGAVDETPSRSRDGQTIVFSSQRDGNAEIYKMNADGSNLVRLTADADAPDAPVDTNPVISPDNSKIVWQSTRAAAPGGQPARRLYIMDISGANQRPVVFDDENQPSFDGSWSRDNNQLLGFFVNPNNDGNNDLAVIMPGNGTAIPATATVIRAGTRSAHARYSPAGGRIVLSDGATGVGQLQFLDENGTFTGQGPGGGTDQSNPSFNPAGTRLVWDARSATGQDRQLYVADVVAGTTQPTGVAITSQGENYQASWAQ